VALATRRRGPDLIGMLNQAGEVPIASLAGPLCPHTFRSQHHRTAWAAALSALRVCVISMLPGLDEIGGHSRLTQCRAGFQSV
jgi:hypothetical protein